MITFAKTVSLLALFMIGERMDVPLAPLLALPLIPLMKPLTSRKTAERVIGVLFIPCAAVTGAAALMRFSDEIASTSMPQTPTWVIAAAVFAVSVWIVSGGSAGVGKWAAFALPVVIGFVLIAALLLAGKLREVGLALPHVWERNPVLIICEAVTLLGLMPAIKYKEKPFRAYLSATAIAAVVCAAVWALCCLTLGADTAQSVNVPFFAALRIAKGGEVIGRIEAFLIPVTLFLTAAKCAACLLVIGHSLSRYGIIDNSAKALNLRSPAPSLPET